MEGESRNGNRLLSRLAREDFEQIAPHLRRVRQEMRDPLWEPNRPIETVYFPITSVSSVISLDDVGGEVEVGTIGNEGVVGLPLFLGASSAPLRAFTQIPGEYYQLPAHEFKRLSNTLPTLREALQLYTQGFMVQVSQSVACNRLHTPEQRLARWLLMSGDRVGGDRFPLTQEFMAQMLGVRRATVNEAAQALQERGLIRYSRGVIEILDRPGLVAAACACYRIVRDEFERLLGESTG